MKTNDAIVYINGKMVNPDEPGVSVFDSAFQRSLGLFETMAGFFGKILFAQEHFSRLESSLVQLGWQERVDLTEIEKQLHSFAESISWPKFSAKLMLSYVDETIQGISGKKKNSAQLQVTIIFRKIYPLDSRIYTDGFKLLECPNYSSYRGKKMKDVNYFHSVMALKSAESQGFDDVLFYNSYDEYAECTVANIFFIGREGDGVFIQTPPLESGILPGITRAVMIMLLEKSKIPVRLEAVHRHELAKFDEVFITSSLRGLIPVQSIGSHKLYTARKNAVFWQVGRLWNAIVQQKLGFAVEWNSGDMVTTLNNPGINPGPKSPDAH